MLVKASFAEFAGATEVTVKDVVKVEVEVTGDGDIVLTGVDVTLVEAVRRTLKFQVVDGTFLTDNLAIFVVHSCIVVTD